MKNMHKLVNTFMVLVLLMSTLTLTAGAQAAPLAEDPLPTATEPALPTEVTATQEQIPTEPPTPEPTPLPTDTPATVPPTSEPPAPEPTAEPTLLPTETPTSETPPVQAPLNPPPPTQPGGAPLILEAQTLSGANIQKHAGTGQVRFLGAQAGHALAQPVALSPDTPPDTAARSFLGAYGQMFGLADQANELAVAKTGDNFDRGRSSVRFQQVYNGIPVLAGELIVNMDAAMNVLSINGELLPKINLDTNPTISAEKAKATALGLATKIAKVELSIDQPSLTVSEPQLWVYNPILLTPERGETSLVWRMEVTPVDLAPIRELVLVDAHSGRVVLDFNQVDTVKSWETYDAENGTVKPGTQVSDDGDYPGSDTHILGADENVSATYDYYNTLFGRLGIDGADTTIITTVHYDNLYNNAFWDGNQMVFGDGATYPLADDVVAHEYTHGVTQNESNLFYYYQSGAINESLSDIFGEFLDQTHVDAGDTLATRWLMGEDVLPGGALRNMKNPPQFRDPDKMTSAYYFTGWEDSGGVHTNSGVGNKAAYLMVDGGIFNGYTVTGLGLPKVAHIYYEANTNLLTSGADYADLQSALYQACRTKVGTAGIVLTDCNAVWNATLAVQMSSQPKAAGSAPEALVCDSSQEVVSPIFSDDLEVGTANFTFGSLFHNGSGSAWSGTYPTVFGPYAHSGTKGLYSDDCGWDADSDNCFGDQYDAPYQNTNSYAAMNANKSLPELSYGQHHYLRFDHAFDLERGWDGGIVEYSTDSGFTWTNAMSLINSGRAATGSIWWCDADLDYDPINEWWYCTDWWVKRPSFTNTSHGYNSTRLLLDALAGQSVRFRWRLFSDPWYAWGGWWVDDIQIYKCGPASTPMAPDAQTPGNDETIYINLPTYTWTQPSGATKYQLKVYTDTDVLKLNQTVTTATCNAGVCSFKPAVGLAAGDYYWTVQAGNSTSPWSVPSGQAHFTTALPSDPTAATPSGSSAAYARPTYKWNKQPGATQYNLRLYKVNTPPKADTRLLNTNIPISSTLLLCDTTDCYYTPATGLKAGDYYWDVRAGNPVGWSGYSGQVSFTATIPNVPTASTPSGSSAAHAKPTYTWSKQDGATSYNLHVYKDNILPKADTLLLNVTIPLSSRLLLCDTTNCYYTPVAGLKAGDYNWDVRAGNAAGWSTYSTPQVGFSAVAPAAPDARIPTITTWRLRPIYKWTKVSEATQYVLLVRTDPGIGTPKQIINQTVSVGVTAGLSCNSTLCSYTPARNLVAGIDYQWDVSARNTAGTSASDHDTFTVDLTDTDGDALPDSWETSGYDADGDGVVDVDLPAMGADSNRIDIFVEMDYMVSPSCGDLGPDAGMIDDIEAVFANAPVSNPDLSTGITIHLEKDDQVPFNDSLGWSGNYNTVWAEFDAIKSKYFDLNRLPTHHYMIWANTYLYSEYSGLARNIPSSDFIVSLGNWTSCGSYYERLGTFIHELGHNLGLKHGGNDHVNSKPNYLSIMNYQFQTYGLYKDGDWGNNGHPLNFDYQRLNLPNLNEGRLNETIGLSGSDNVSAYGAVYYVPSDYTWYLASNASVAIDWNGSGVLQTSVASDVNGDGRRTILGTQNNWPNIIYHGGNIIGSGLPVQVLKQILVAKPVLVLRELTLKMQQKLDLMRKQLDMAP